MSSSSMERKEMKVSERFREGGAEGKGERVSVQAMITNNFVNETAGVNVS